MSGLIRRDLALALVSGALILGMLMVGLPAKLKTPSAEPPTPQTTIHVGQWYDWPPPAGVPVVGMYRTASGLEIYAAFIVDEGGQVYEWWGLGRNPVPVRDDEAPEKWCRRPEFGKEIGRE